MSYNLKYTGGAGDKNGNTAGNYSPAQVPNTGDSLHFTTMADPEQFIAFLPLPTPKAYQNVVADGGYWASTTPHTLAFGASTFVNGYVTPDAILGHNMRVSGGTFARLSIATGTATIDFNDMTITELYNRGGTGTGGQDFGVGSYGGGVTIVNGFTTGGGFYVVTVTGTLTMEGGGIHAGGTYSGTLNLNGAGVVVEAGTISGTVNVNVTPTTFGATAANLNLSGATIKAHANLTVTQSGANTLTIDGATVIKRMNPNVTITQTGTFTGGLAISVVDDFAEYYASLDATSATGAAILTDTAEVQAELANGGRLDQILDRIACFVSGDFVKELDGSYTHYDIDGATPLFSEVIGAAGRTVT